MNKLKKPPRPFAMRQWLSTEPYRKQIEDIKVELQKGSVSKFNLELRLKSALDLLEERNDLKNYALAMESYARRLKRALQVGKSVSQEGK